MPNDNVTAFPKPKLQPVSIHWGPVYEQMEQRGVSKQFITAFRLQTLEYDAMRDERDLLRHHYADLGEKCLQLESELNVATTEVERLERRLADEQGLTQKLANLLEDSRNQLRAALDGT